MQVPLCVVVHNVGVVGVLNAMYFGCCVMYCASTHGNAAIELCA